ncbi:MAG TPA: ROK family protein [Verrucomicrobiae bacterium]|jgi:glucokinase|nr:ROK family protein [Verrucomicrobiae bacterium]
MAKFAIGVDLGGTNLRIAAVHSSGKVLEKITLGTEVARRDRVIDEMCIAIRDLAARHKAAGALAGMGIGVPGIIDMESGMLRASPNLPGWHDYPVRNEIERRLGTPVILENDGNAAALGEKWLGAASAVEDMCMITMGTGIGGGIVLQGRIWHGMTGMAAELGHVTVEPEGVLCGCGSHGCVEQYASASAIKRMAMEAIASGKAPELARAMSEDPEFSAKAVYQLALQGDEAARQIFRRAGKSLGMLVADLINIFNLPIYVIGGGVASAWDAFAPAMLEEVRLRSYIYKATAPAENARETEDGNIVGEEAPAGPRTIITQAMLGSDAGLIGAARLPMMAHG